MYLVLSGGFYGQARKPDIWGFPTNDQLGGKDRGTDFILEVKGLPAKFVKPEEMKSKFKYFCKKCNEYVTEWHVERKEGCYVLHRDFIDVQKEVLPGWRTGVMEGYSQRALPWMTNAIRIWIDNEQGKEKWRNIVRYIKAKYPASRSLTEITPKAMGTARITTVTVDSVPVVDLGKCEEETADANNAPTMKDLQKEIEEVRILKQQLSRELNKIKPRKEEPKNKKADVECDICGKVFKGQHALKLHNRFKHKEKTDVIRNDDSNTDTTSSVDNKEGVEV